MTLGLPGDHGPDGESGTPGKDGEPGIDGLRGVKGNRGEAGRAILPGEWGEQGNLFIFSLFSPQHEINKHGM